MPRQMRIDFPGAIHHVMSRGDRRENIYLVIIDEEAQVSGGGLGSCGQKRAG